MKGCHLVSDINYRFDLEYWEITGGPLRVSFESYTYSGCAELLADWLRKNKMISSFRVLVYEPLKSGE